MGYASQFILQDRIFQANILQYQGDNDL